MKPCKTCGRVNPAEATYCMTCGTSLKEAPSQERRSSEDFSRRASSQSRGADPVPNEGPFEKAAPIVEDFVWDMMRAGAKMYFGFKDPSRAGVRDAQGRRVNRFERFKDILAEARVDYRRRGGKPDNGRDRY